MQYVTAIICFFIIQEIKEKLNQRKSKYIGSSILWYLDDDDKSVVKHSTHWYSCYNQQHDQEMVHSTHNESDMCYLFIYKYISAAYMLLTHVTLYITL